MKKVYIEPSIAMDSMDSEQMVCASQDIVSSGATGDITYGGVDEEGTLDPASRRFDDVWEDSND